MTGTAHGAPYLRDKWGNSTPLLNESGEILDG